MNSASSTRHRNATRYLVAGCHMTIILLLVAGGCHRRFYRRQADNEAYYLVNQKRSPECWPLDGYTIDIDPGSRMYDPFNPDRPPMPPDDPTSHRLMHCVDGKRGYHGWHRNGDTQYVENPRWMEALPVNEDGILSLDIHSAVHTALLNSPDYQRELEDLYLSALDVSFQRFRFDTQFFGGYSGLFNVFGEDRFGAPGQQSSSTVDLSTNSQTGGTFLQARKLFANGADLVVGVANSLMWELSGPDSHTALTVLDFSLFQPLLRGGGRDVVLEQLTQAERGLLANVRQMARFRREFYVQVVAGRSAVAGPVRFGPSLVGLLNGFTNTSGQAGGYLGLIQAQQDIRNQRSNIAALQSSVAQLEAFFLAGRIDYFQVELTRQALFDAQSRLLNSERNLQTALDEYKITLGLPPYVEVVVDDTVIKPFQLLDPKIVPLQNRLTLLQQQVGQSMNQLFSEVVSPPDDIFQQRGRLPAPVAREPVVAGPAPPERNAAVDNDADPGVEFDVDTDLATDVDTGASPQATPPPRPSLVWSPLVERQLTTLRKQLAQALEILQKARKENVPIARDDNSHLRDSLDERLESTQLLRRQLTEWLKNQRYAGSSEKITAADIEAILPVNTEQLRELPVVLDDTIDDVVRQFEAIEGRMRGEDQRLAALLEGGPDLSPEELFERLQEEVLTAVPSEINTLAATVLSLSLVQARARTESVTLPTVDMDWESALTVARGNRLDWMNARASLVDTWRDIQVTANDLESRLDLVVSGDLQHQGSSLTNNRHNSGRLRLGLEFDAPLTRLEERNSYRESLITYQQTRRAYYQFEDGVTSSLRDIIRRLRINQINFELQRAAVEVAISQVELSRLRLQQPPPPEQQQVFSATTARDLVTALSGLLNSQNDFLSVFVSQEVLRRALDLDLGTMRLDPTGIWIDPGPRQEGGNASPAKAGDLPPSPEPPSDPPAPPPQRLQAPPPERLQAPPADEPPLPIRPAREPGNGPLILPSSTIQPATFHQPAPSDRPPATGQDDPSRVRRLPPAVPL